jgi:hypothetical protein
MELCGAARLVGRSSKIIMHKTHSRIGSTGAPARIPLRPFIGATRLGSWLIAASLLLFCLSDTMLALEIDSSPIVKLLAFGLMGAAIALRPRFERNILLVAPMLFALLVSLTRAYNDAAGVEEFMRFLCPVMITIALFAYRDHLAPILRMFFAIVATNDLYQIWAYIAGLTGLPLLMPIRLDSGMFIRAQGWMGFFSEFSFINFCAFVICRRYQPTPRSLSASWVFLAFSFMGFSFKIVPAIALFPFTARRLRWQAMLGLAAIICGLGVALMTGALDSVTGLAIQKLGFYVVDGNSARAESYRVMIESLSNWNMLGEGLGSFGGPASIKYDSPLYSMYHFNWYGLGSILRTTDTFYPHLFVELGFIGAVLWLWIVLRYGTHGLPNKTWRLIVATFCFDNVFSLAFVSASYVFAALLAMYLFRHPDSTSARMPPDGIDRRPMLVS